MEQVQLSIFDPSSTVLSLGEKLTLFAKQLVVEQGYADNISRLTSILELAGQCINSLSLSYRAKTQKFIVQKFVDVLLRKYPYLKYLSSPLAAPTALDHSRHFITITFPVSPSSDRRKKENVLTRYINTLNRKAIRLGIPIKVVDRRVEHNQLTRVNQSNEAEELIVRSIQFWYGLWSAPAEYNAALSAEGKTSLDQSYEDWCKTNDKTPDYNNFHFVDYNDIVSTLEGLYPFQWRTEQLLMYLQDFATIFKTFARMNANFLPAAFDIGVGQES